MNKFQICLRFCNTLIYTLLLVFLSTVAYGQDDCVSLSWTAPTQNEDGTSLTDLAGFKIYRGDVEGTYTENTDIPDPLATTYEWCGLAVGTHYFVGTAYNESGIESRYSNVAVKELLPSTVPLPPTGLTAGDGEIAYTLQQIEDGLVMYPVGVVSGTVECNPNIRIFTANYPAGLSLIPKASVTFPPGVSARTLYAQCSSS